MGWTPGNLLRVSPRAHLGYAWVSPKVAEGSEDLFLPFSIEESEIVMYIGPDDRHPDNNDWYFYLMTSSGSVVLGVRQDFTRVGNVKV